MPAGMSIDLLQELHLLTRDGHLNADARRKLKQIRHLVGLLRPGLEDALARIETEIDSPHTRHLAEFIRSSERGICSE